MREIALDIAGLGLILYSPPAVAHIADGDDYLQSHFWEPEDVARHVTAGQLIAFCTGSPGSYRVRFHHNPATEQAVAKAEFKLRLALQVHDTVVCVRDLYELMDWEAACPAEQQVQLANGWYRLTVLSSYPRSGRPGDKQLIHIHLEPVARKPTLRWDGVPNLCE
jgi:hypothetical protein